MSIRYCPDLGFIDTDFWPHDLPAFAVEVTADRHAELLEELAQGRVLQQGDDGQPFTVDPPPPAEADLADAARRRRDFEIADTRWLIDRHRDEVSMGVTTTLTVEDYQLVLQHVQALRDLPEQDNFPLEIDWPALPEELLPAAA